MNSSSSARVARWLLFAAAAALAACGARSGLRVPDAGPLGANDVVALPDVVAPLDVLTPLDVQYDVPGDTTIVLDAMLLDGTPVIPTQPFQAYTLEVGFETRIRSADVFFLVDNSASMDSIIAALTASFSSRIVPGLRAAIGDLRVGVGSFDSMPDGTDGNAGHPGDYTLWVRQRLDADAARSQAAFDAMHTIDADTRDFFGGDGPEDSTEAIFESLQGDGSRGHEADTAARRSVVDALDPGGDGWVPAVAPVTDCPGVAGAFGWACFETGRVPIIVLASDAEWYDGPAPALYHSPAGHDFPALVATMWAHGAYFIGIDVGSGIGGPTYMASQTLARGTRTVDARGNPLVFGPGAGDLSATAAMIVDGITAIAGQSRQDVSGRAIADPTETRLPAGHTTADFVRGVVPARAVPEAPAGYDHRDGTTFYGVAPSTQVFFDVVVVNDFVAPGPVAQTFRVNIAAIGRAGAELDRHEVLITVPAM